MIRLLSLLILSLALAEPAFAHRLKVFATAEGGSIKGYAFFIGGGRAANTPWLAKDSSGNGFTNGTTDQEGRFTLVIPPSVESGVTITVDTREGHIASATLGADQVGGLVKESSNQVNPMLPSGGSVETGEKVAGLVDAAVQRHVGRLMEQIERMDSRLRFTDVLSGIFLILGLSGMALWASSQRK